jgi:hypothetical protein
MFVSQTNSRLPACPYFSVAITAIHWSALAGLERYFSFFTTISTHCREHLAPRPVAVAIITIAAATVSILACFPCLTALGAALWLVGIASRLELLLFLSGKGKAIPAIGTFKGLVLKTHWMTSSLNYLARVRAIQYLV